MAQAKTYLALLTDGENVPASSLTDVLTATSQHGHAAIRQVYGDFSKPNMKSWSQAASNHGLLARHVAVGTTGKNAVDMAIAIDAMDMVSNSRVDGFVLATSDADFPELALRLRERDFFILGVGETKAPAAFVSACTAFERLVAAKKVAPAVASFDSPTASLVWAILGGLATGEWIALSAIGTEMRNRGYEGQGSLKKKLELMDDVEIQSKANHASACLKKVS